jgi:hypothetical protein
MGGLWETVIDRREKRVSNESDFEHNITAFLFLKKRR